MSDIVADNDPWAGWAIDPRDAADFEIGQQCILRAEHENGTWWLSLLGTVTEKIGEEWGFRVEMILDGEPGAMLVFDVPTKKRL